MGIEHFEMFQILLLAVSIAAMITSKLRLPYSVGLVFIGGILAVFPIIANISLTKDLIYKVLLPPLIFEAALFLPQKALFKEFPLIISMATIGVLLAATVITLGLIGCYTGHGLVPRFLAPYFSDRSDIGYRYF